MTSMERCLTASTIRSDELKYWDGKYYPPSEGAEAAGESPNSTDAYVPPSDESADAGLSPLDIKGRNAWMLWTGGNELFWDWLSRHGYDSLDFLKLVDSDGAPTAVRESWTHQRTGHASSDKRGDKGGLWHPL